MARTAGSRAICTRVARVSALIGLNAAFPSSLTQISCRMRVVTGQRRPAAMSASAIALHRSDRVPSGSPSEMRLPSVCLITPGSVISVPR